ncbi:MAG TPA: helix-turn-helix transcriptional regulator [Pirellulales bacterium]
MAKSKSKPAPSLPDALRSAIEASGISSYELGKLSGVDQSAIRRFMSGERDLRLEFAGKLATVLRLSLVQDRKPKI